jgi:L-aspartate semialdehyde sulfurtransferase ferredoxin
VRAGSTRLPVIYEEVKMATRKVMLKYPERLIQEPVLFRMVRQFDVMPNIRRARVTDTVGEIALELEGSPENLERGVRYLQEQGVQVEPLEGDVVSP